MGESELPPSWNPNHDDDKEGLPPESEAGAMEYGTGGTTTTGERGYECPCDQIKFLHRANAFAGLSMVISGILSVAQICTTRFSFTHFILALYNIFFGFCIVFTILVGVMPDTIYDWLGILRDLRGVGMFHVLFALGWIGQFQGSYGTVVTVFSLIAMLVGLYDFLFGFANPDFKKLPLMALTGCQARPEDENAHDEFVNAPDVELDEKDVEDEKDQKDDQNDAPIHISVRPQAASVNVAPISSHLSPQAAMLAPMSNSMKPPPPSKIAPLQSQSLKPSQVGALSAGKNLPPSVSQGPGPIVQPIEQEVYQNADQSGYSVEQIGQEEYTYDQGYQEIAPDQQYQQAEQQYQQEDYTYQTNQQEYAHDQTYQGAQDQQYQETDYKEYAEQENQQNLYTYDQTYEEATGDREYQAEQPIEENQQYGLQGDQSGAVSAADSQPQYDENQISSVADQQYNGDNYGSEEQAAIGANIGLDEQQAAAENQSPASASEDGGYVNVDSPNSGGIVIVDEDQS